jgi:hypothetical protein
MAYNLLTILCRSTEEAAFAAAKLGTLADMDRLFVFLQSEPAPESIMWMNSQDRSITLERAIEHQDAEDIGVRAAVLYSASHYWTLLFCWAYDSPEADEVHAAISALNQDAPVQGKLWGNLRENIVLDGFEAVYRPKTSPQSGSSGLSESSILNEELELSFGMRGMPVSRKVLIQIIAETAPLRGVGIHPSVQKDNPFWNDIQNLMGFSASVNQESPSTCILGHSDSLNQTLEYLKALPKHSTAVVFATKSTGEEIASSVGVPPYRIVYGKDDIMALLFKIA